MILNKDIHEFDHLEKHYIQKVIDKLKGVFKRARKKTLRKTQR